jgi:2-dehydropantoate 2-reductase
MERVGASVTVAPDVSGIVWAKLCANCAINPVAALLDVDNGTLVGHGPARLLMKKVVDEVTAVAEAKGIQLPFPPEEAFDRVVKVAEMNARNLCSMVQDLRRGKTTEIEALNGALVREAERLGIDTPANRTLANLIRTRQQFLGSGRILV